MATHDDIGRILNDVSSVIVTQADMTVADAAKELRQYGIGCVVVTDQSGRITGILSERDILGRVVAAGGNPQATRVGEIMTTDVATCSVDTPLRDAQELMAKCHIRHLPVVQDGVPVGMLSSRDLMTYQVAAERKRKDVAEQVAKLSNSLRSLDFDEVVSMVTHEVPAIFSAARSVLCFPEDIAIGAKSFRINRCNCPCDKRDLERRTDNGDLWQLDVVCGQAPQACSALGGQSPCVMIPLLSHGASEWLTDRPENARGFLCMCELDQDQDDLDESVAYKGKLLHSVLGANLVHAKLYSDYVRAKQASVTDPLTGVGTRRLFKEALAAESIRASRYARPFCVAIVDIDHFKHLNDRSGHDAGDRALKDICASMTCQKRPTDVIARYGGDEFALLLPETPLDGALALLNRIRSTIEDLPDRDGRRLTLSCGVAEFDSAADAPPDDVVRRADIALYQAKKNGRDRIECWEPSVEGPQEDAQIESQRVLALEGRVNDLLGKSKEGFIQSLRGLVQALDAKDPHTKGHSENVTHYSVHIAQTLGIADEDISVIRRAAHIHDVGKIGIPDHILRKQGDLTSRERETMEQHPMIAVRILDQMNFLSREAPIVRHHHERWDGRGYPDGISGEGIQLGARILAVADAFDAITCTRAYHDARSVCDAMEALQQGAAAQFDPDVVDAMISWIRTVEKEIGPAEITTDHLLAYRPSEDALGLMAWT
ncbi:MAG: diguanylate cyclase [Planctomycetota bacterium]